jgi:hypothetical protein
MQTTSVATAPTSALSTAVLNSLDSRAVAVVVLVCASAANIISRRDVYIKRFFGEQYFYREEEISKNSRWQT